MFGGRGYESARFHSWWRRWGIPNIGQVWTRIYPTMWQSVKARWPLKVEDLSPVTALLQEAVNQTVEGEDYIPVIGNFFTAPAPGLFLTCLGFFAVYSFAFNGSEVHLALFDWNCDRCVQKQKWKYLQCRYEQTFKQNFKFPSIIIRIAIIQ